MSTTRHRLARTSAMLALGASLMAVGTAAMAQTPAATNAGPAAAEEPVDGNSIIVTARRSNERLQDVPIVVNVLGREDIERQRLDGLADFARKTPGFKFESFTGLQAQPTIRGQTNLRTTSPVQNVSTNINGIYIQRNYMVDQGLLDLERVEIIKGPQTALYGRNAFAGVISLITRGPDLDELSGRISGTIGSDKRYDAKASVSVPIVPGVLAVYGSVGYSKFDGTWRNNHPLANAGSFTTGKLGGWNNRAYQLGVKLKLGELVTLEGTYIRTERKIESTPTYTLSTSGLTYPIVNGLNASPGVTSGVRQNRLYVGELLPNTGPFPGETRLPGLVIDPRTYGLRGPSEVWIAKLKVDNGGPVGFDATYGRTKSSIETRGSSARDPLFNLTIVPFGTFGTVFDSSGTNSSFVSDSVDARGLFNFGRLTGFVGVNFSRTSDIDSNASEFATPGTLDPANPASLFPVVPGGVIPTALFRRSTFLQRVENVFSTYGYVQYKPTDRIAITLEGRYTQEDQRANDLIAPDVGIAFGGKGTGFIAPVPPTATRSVKFFTPRGSLTYKFSDDNNVYVSAGRGYKSGGQNGVAGNYNRNSTVAGVVVTDAITVGQPIPVPRAGATAVAFVQTTPASAGISQLQQNYSAETNITYEIGSKNRFFDGRLTLNVSAFLTNWSNLQSNAVRLNPDGTPPGSFAAIVPSLIGNVGNVRVYGFEVDGNVKIIPEVRLDFGASYSHSRYKRGTYSQRFGASGNCDGVVCSYVTAPGFSYPVLDISGKQLERTPQFDAVVGLNFDTKFANGWGFFARGDVTYQSKQFADEANLAFVPSRTLANASVGVDIGNFNVTLWSKNLFNRKYVTASLFLIGIGGGGSASYVPVLGEQRTGGLTATFKF